ncbi:hypothetical protein D3C72_1809640 [compost metagenome]
MDAGRARAHALQDGLQPQSALGGQEEGLLELQVGEGGGAGSEGLLEGGEGHLHVGRAWEDRRACHGVVGQIRQEVE